MIEEQGVVAAPFDERETIVQNFVGAGIFAAKQGAPGFREQGFIDFSKHGVEVLPGLAKCIASAGLELGEARFHHVSLFAALEIFAAAANPFLAFEHQVGELRGDFLS
jgi:hypothetical protein